jgi:hypothetical protein
MTTKETKSLNIHQAMLKFHKEFRGAQKSGTNLHFKSKYFTLDDLVEATTPVLQKCGLYVTHFVESGYLITMIRTDSGEHVGSSIFLPETQNPQVMGSNLTYFKKYNMTGLLNIPEASDLDDDGSAGAKAAIYEDKKSEREPQPPVTDQQRELLNKHLDAFKLNPAAVREAKQLEKYLNSDSFTEAHAREILRKFKEIG